MKSQMRFWSAWICLSVSLGALTYSGADAADTTLIEFGIKDQFKHKHSDTEFRGRTLIVVGSDKKGSKIGDTWTNAIRDSLSSDSGAGTIPIVEVADVRGVPFFIKGMVRGKFPKDESNWALLDWKGKLAKAYEFEKHKVNILVFDPTGLLKCSVAVTTLETDVLATILSISRHVNSNTQVSAPETAVDTLGSR